MQQALQAYLETMKPLTFNVQAIPFFNEENRLHRTYQRGGSCFAFIFSCVSNFWSIVEFAAQIPMFDLTLPS
jgi:hypothetical protein